MVAHAIPLPPRHYYVLEMDTDITPPSTLTYLKNGVLNTIDDLSTLFMTALRLASFTQPFVLVQRAFGKTIYFYHTVEDEESFQDVFDRVKKGQVVDYEEEVTRDDEEQEIVQPEVD